MKNLPILVLTLGGVLLLSLGTWYWSSNRDEISTITENQGEKTPELENKLQIHKTVQPAKEAELQKEAQLQKVVQSQIQNSFVVPISNETIVEDAKCVWPLLQWKEEQTQMYQLSYNTQMELSLVNLFTAPKEATSSSAAKQALQKVYVDIEGTLNLRVHEVKKESTLVGFQLSPVQVLLNGVQMLPLEELYGNHFLVSFAKSGQIQKFYFPKQISTKDRASLQGLIRTFQMKFPVGKSPQNRSWENVEPHPNGLVRSSYQVEDNGCLSFSKSNLEFQSVSSSFGRALPSDLLSRASGKFKNSRYFGSFSPGQSWFQELQGSESYEVSFSGKKIVDSSLYFSLKKIPYQPDSSLAIWKNISSTKQLIAGIREKSPIASLSQATSKTEKSSTPQSKGFWESLDDHSLRKRFQGTSEKELVVDLRQQIPKGIQGLHQYMKDLEDYLRLYPEKTEGVLEILQEENIKGSESGALIQVLSLVGHTEAQNILATVMNGEQFSRHARLQSIISMSNIKKPEAQLIDSLWSLSALRDRQNRLDYERSNTALLALGALGKNLHNAENYAGSEEIKRRLSQFVQKNERVMDRFVGIKALGNVGDSSIRSTLEPFLQSEKKELRRVSLQSMRFFKDEQTIATYLNFLQSDPSIQVREAVMVELSEISRADIIDIVGKVLPTEPQDTIRKKMIRYLGGHLSQYPEVREILTAHAEQEESKENMKAIYTALYSVKKS